MSVPIEADDKVNASLVAVKGRMETRSFSLEDGDRHTMGRGENVDFQIMDHGLSRLHCAIGRKEGSIYVEDLGSRNGTWVNGVRITRAHLSSGDSVRIGSVEFEFKLGTEEVKEDTGGSEEVDLEGNAIRKKFDLDRTDLMFLSSKLESVEKYRQVQSALAAIYKIGNLINSVTNLDGLFKLLMDSVLEVTDSERGFLILHSDDSGHLQPVVSAGRSDAPVDGESETLSFSRTIVEECYRSGDSFFTPDALADDRLRDGDSIIMQQIRSAMCVPVQTHDRTLGVIYVDTVTTAEAFDRHELELLTAVGKQAGIAIDRASLLDRVQTRLYETVRTVVATIEAKDNYTVGHSERVTAYAMQIAEEMGFVGEGLANVQLACLLHDVGKIGTPEHILNKRGKLTDEELEVIKRHPAVGQRIIANIKETSAISSIVRHHHEKFDGSGYPDGLVGEAIPIEARILAAADAFDAMTSNRPYRQIFTKDQVIKEFRTHSGTHFDPTVTEVFLGLYKKGRIYVPELIYVGQATGEAQGPLSAAFSLRRSPDEPAGGEPLEPGETVKSQPKE